MERDCFVSYGVSSVLMERFLYASDAFITPVCKTCGFIAEGRHNEDFGVTVIGKKMYCRLCNSGDAVVNVTVSYPFKLLQQELGAIGISVRHKFEN